jgi:predicted RNA methylase
MYTHMEMNIIGLEQQLDDIISTDPPFGEWYFSNDTHFSMLPDIAYTRYKAARCDMISEAFRLKMIMRKNKWDEAYLANEFMVIKQSVNAEFETPDIAHVYTNHFTHQDYITQFRGVTNYKEAYDTVTKFREYNKKITG